MAQGDDRGGAGLFSVIGALVVGAAVGAILGLLFAPKSGKELREEIKEKAAEGAEELKAKAEELKTKAEDIAHQVREHIETQVAEAEPPSEGEEV